MEKDAIRTWRRSTFRLLRSIDPTWLPGCPTFAAGMILAGIAAIGTDTTALVELTGYPEGLITKTLRRARKAKIVVGQSMRTHWESEHGGFALMLDALTATAEVMRVPNPKRSAAAKARARKTTTRSTARRPKVVVPVGAVFTPKQVKAKPWYIHEKYLTK